MMRTLRRCILSCRMLWAVMLACPLARPLCAEPRHYWSANFTLQTDIRPHDAERILELLQSLRVRHLEQLCLEPAAIPKIPITIFRKRADFDKFGRDFNALIVGARGVATSQGVFVYFGRSRQDCLGVLVHELTHAYLRAANKRVAAWLNEGLACYFGGLRRGVGGRVVFGVPHSERLIVVVRALRTNRHIPLRKLLGIPKKDFYAGHSEHGRVSAYERLVYGEASTFVRFLMRSKAEPVKGRFKRFLGEVYQMEGSPQDRARQAFETVYGSDYERIERLWRSYAIGLLK